MEQITRTPKQLGTLLRRRRELALTQEALASRIHLRQATVSALENSAADSRLATLFGTLAALDLELLVRPRSKGSVREIEELFRRPDTALRDIQYLIRKGVLVKASAGGRSTSYSLQSSGSMGQTER
jgi:HTH-type transcriptional regulator / antitoxin HipB